MSCSPRELPPRCDSYPASAGQSPVLRRRVQLLKAGRFTYNMIGQPRCHGGRAGPPPRGGARAVGGSRLCQRLAYAGMGQAEIVVDMVQNELLAQADLPLAEG